MGILLLNRITNAHRKNFRFSMTFTGMMHLAQEPVGCRQKFAVCSNKPFSKSLDLPLGRQRGKNKALRRDSLLGAPTAQLAGMDRKDGFILLVTVSGFSLPSEHPAPHSVKQDNQQVQE